MKINNKKIISIFLSVLCLMTILTGCAKEKKMVEYKNSNGIFSIMAEEGLVEDKQAQDEADVVLTTKNNDYYIDLYYTEDGFEEGIIEASIEALDETMKTMYQLEECKVDNVKNIEVNGLKGMVADAHITEPENGDVVYRIAFLAGDDGNLYEIDFLCPKSSLKVLDNYSMEVINSFKVNK